MEKNMEKQHFVLLIVYNHNQGDPDILAIDFDARKYSFTDDKRIGDVKLAADNRTSTIYVDNKLDIQPVIRNLKEDGFIKAK